jgi:hypothetical protein
VKDIITAKRKEKRQQSALLYFWNYNTMEATLLFSASMTVLCGLMFQSDQMKPNPDGSVNSWSEGLFWLTMSIILFSTLYFFVIFTSDIATAFGYTTSCQKKKLQKALEIEMEKGDSVDMDQNPLHHGRGDDEADSEAVAQSRQDLIEAQETIQRMQDELKSIKQERKRAELGAMGSFKGSSHNKLARGNSARGKKKIIGKQTSGGDMDMGFHFAQTSANPSAAAALPPAATSITAAAPTDAPHAERTQQQTL